MSFVLQVVQGGLDEDGLELHSHPFPKLQIWVSSAAVVGLYVSMSFIPGNNVPG